MKLIVSLECKNATHETIKAMRLQLERPSMDYLFYYCAIIIAFRNYGKNFLSKKKPEKQVRVINGEIVKKHFSILK